MFKISKIILAVVIVILAIYMIGTSDFDLLFFSNFLLGIFFLIMGIEEFKTGNKGFKWVPWMCIVVSVLMFYASIQGWFLLA